MFNRITIQALTALLLTGVACAASAADEQRATKAAAPEYQIFPWPMMTDANAPKEAKELAKKASKTLKIHTIGESEHNPVCCLWVEITAWQPNPNIPGYLITIHPGGGIVSATGPHQLDLAFQHLAKLRREQDGRTMLPLGVVTNYPVIAPDKNADGPAKRSDTADSDLKELRALALSGADLPKAVRLKRFDPEATVFIRMRSNPQIGSDSEFLNRLLEWMTRESDLRGEEADARLYALYDASGEIVVNALLFPKEDYAKSVLEAAKSRIAQLEPNQRAIEEPIETWLRNGRIVVKLKQDYKVSDKAFDGMREAIEKVLKSVPP